MAPIHEIVFDQLYYLKVYTIKRVLPTTDDDCCAIIEYLNKSHLVSGVKSYLYDNLYIKHDFYKFVYCMINEQKWDSIHERHDHQNTPGICAALIIASELNDIEYDNLLMKLINMNGHSFRTCAMLARFIAKIRSL